MSCTKLTDHVKGRWGHINNTDRLSLLETIHLPHTRAALARPSLHMSNICNYLIHLNGLGKYTEWNNQFSEAEKHSPRTAFCDPTEMHSFSTAACMGEYLEPVWMYTTEILFKSTQKFRE